ncbi:nuclear pore complex protein NUP1-like isoform X2 [Phragmites australis]|uniref:nuclear pore complex protein NUP1-like isoform X2 n=1 Tax=Phragmites australis TaxID=29695 RepID=UPI002D78E6A2|nr:nuclear pore complex protein NUP1-like isoform X2 [Phragmites australis]
MASRGAYGYDYGGGFGAGGKIRRRPPSRAAAASPYARPAPAPAPAAAAASQGGGWLSRIIAAGASRLLPSLFRKPPPQLAAPPPQPELLDAPPERSEASHDLQPLRLEPLDVPPSPLPPPLEDDLPESEENDGAIANNLFTKNTESSAKDGEEHMLRNSDDSGAMHLEELLKQSTFTRSEFEYLTELLWSRTIGSNSLKPEDSNIKKMHVSEKENGSRHSNIPVDFSIRSYSVAQDQVASPAEIAKAYMGSKSSKGSPLRLRLHDPSSLPIKSIEANMIQKAKPPTIPLFQGSRLHTSKISDCLESNFATPNRSAIYKMSSSPYFKSAASSKDLFGTVSSSYRTPSSVHTFGRQVLKRKSTAVNNETVSIGPIRKMHQRYNRTSPLLETRPGHRGHFRGHGSILNEDSEHSAQTQKRRCLDKVGDAVLGGLDDRAHANSFAQAPVQSAEMAAKILKQLDTLVPSQKEDTPEIKQKHGNAMDVGNLVSRKREVSTQSNLLEPSPSGVKEYSLLNGINGTAKFTPAAVTEKSVDATSNTSVGLMSKSISKITSPKDKPPTFSLRSHAPSNLVLSSEIDRNKMPITSNGFTFPVPAVLGAHSQAPPTPTMASPPILPVEKQQPSPVSSASVTSVENGPRILKSVSEEESIAQKCDKKLNADEKPVSSKNSGQVASFTCNPVFKLGNSKPTTLCNGPEHTSNSTASAVLPGNGSMNSASFPSAGFSTISTNSASKSTQNSSTGGSFTFSNTGTGSLPAASSMFAGTSSQSVAAPSLASSGKGSGSTPFRFSPLFGTACSSAAQDKSKAVSSSTPFTFSQKFGTTSSSDTQDKSNAVSSSTPFSFSQQFGTASNSAAQDISKAASPEPTIFSGNKHAQSGNSNSLFTQSSTNNLGFKSSEMSNCGSSQSLAGSPVGSTPLVSSPFNSNSVFSLAAGSGSTSAAATAPPFSPAISSAFGSNPAFSASPIFGSKLTTTATPSFGLPNTSPATSPFSSTSSAVFSFTAATPIPNSSPTTPVFGGVSPTVSLTQMNGGNMIADKNESPLPTASPFGMPSSSPSTPLFSSPATQFASTTSASPDIFQFGQQSQASSGGFSMGTGGGNEKSGRRIIRVKRKK